MELEICMTAINRPEIVEKTISTMTDKIKGIDFNKSIYSFNYIHL